jgi:hypothetical protein
VNNSQPVVINETGLSLDEIKQLRNMGFEVAEQGSDEWHQERLGLATASKFYDIVNWTKGRKLKDGSWSEKPKPQATWYSYRNELLAERISGHEKRFSSKPMEWGITHEQDAADAYELETGNVVGTVGFIKHPDMDAGASLDRIVREDGIVEIKAPNTDTMISYVLNNAPPPNYWTQMQGQMWISGRTWGDFVVFDPFLSNVFIKRIERDDEFINNVLVPRLKKFLAEVDSKEQWLREQGYGAAE